MKCTYLIAYRDAAICSALETPYVPSPFQLGEYCRASYHRKCPFYLDDISTVICQKKLTRLAVSINSETDK